MVLPRGSLFFSGPVEEGNSGGPLLYNGKVVALITETVGSFKYAKPAVIAQYELKNWDVVFGDSSMEIAVGSLSPAKPLRPLDLHENTSLPRTITGKDGAPLVLVPAGDFTMGLPISRGGIGEYPEHDVYLKDFYIDQYEVTVERYHQYMIQTNRSAPDFWDQVEWMRDAQKPVVGIVWQDAHDYCQRVGRRLPTEAEWEKAAKGTDNRIYPWGNSKPNDEIANFKKGAPISGTNLYEEKLTNVGNYEQGKSPYGAYDMAGNVWEWVQDWFGEDYYRNSPRENPQGPSSGEFKVLRGGSWFGHIDNLRSSARNWNRSEAWNYPWGWKYVTGVRCAQGAP